MAQSLICGEVDSATSKETGYASLPNSRSASGGERPSTALARGVQIVEYSDPAGMRQNPQPITSANDESVILLEEYLCPRKLRDLTGIDNLEEVHFLELRVDTRDTSLGNFGMHVPNLTQLKLSNSIITCARDLGSCLNNVKVLWMARCCTVDLDGIAALTSLTELYLAFNNIIDISPCSLLERLKILDLEGNNVDDTTQIEFLALCPCLVNLTLEGNPVCVARNPSVTDPSYDYRRMVKSLLPQLQLLDDEPLVDDERQSLRSSSLFDEDWKLIDDLVREGMVVPDEKVEDMPGRPGTAWPQSPTYRPGSALKPQTALRPGSGLGWSPRSGSLPGTADSGRPSSSSRTRSSASGHIGSVCDDDEDAACDLTTGNIVCGSTARALKDRRRDCASKTRSKTKNLIAEFQFKPEHTYDTTLESDDRISSIVEELRQWKLDHKKRMEEIGASRAPQILTIDHSDGAIELSDVDDDDDDDDGSECSDDLAVACSDKPNPLDSLVPQSTLPAIASLGVSRRPDVAAEDAVLRNIYSKLDKQNVDTSSDSSLSSAATSLSGGDVLRPVSGPVLGKTTKYRLGPVVDRPQPKLIDPQRPVLRALTSTPEGPRVPRHPRAGTSRASLGQSTTVDSLVPRVSSSVRQGSLAKMQLQQLLPSKFTK